MRLFKIITNNSWNIFSGLFVDYLKHGLFEIICFSIFWILFEKWIFPDYLSLNYLWIFSKHVFLWIIRNRDYLRLLFVDYLRLFDEWIICHCRLFEIIFLDHLRLFEEWISQHKQDALVASPNPTVAWPSMLFEISFQSLEVQLKSKTH